MKGILSLKIHRKRHFLLKYIFQGKVAIETYSSYTHLLTRTRTRTHTHTRIRIIYFLL
jgi:hypothetical protein